MGQPVSSTNVSYRPAGDATERDTFLLRSHDHANVWFWPTAACYEIRSLAIGVAALGAEPVGWAGVDRPAQIDPLLPVDIPGNLGCRPQDLGAQGLDSGPWCVCQDRRPGQ
jgi:hypothetical protein